MATRLYSSISVETTLASSINNSTTSMTVATGTATTLLGGVTIVANSQFTVAIDPDTQNEEIVFITAGPSGDTFTISRGQAGTGTAGVIGVAHSTGATVKHVLTSDDLTAFASSISPVASLGFSGSTSGTTTVQATAVAGTNTLTLPATTSDTLVGKATTDTLTNKKLSDSTTTIVDVTDATKAIKFDVGGTTAITGTIATAFTTAKTLTLPDATDTLVGKDTTDVLTNKTLTTPVITNPKISLTYSAKTAAYTAVSGDEGGVFSMNNAASIKFSIPTDATFNFAIGTQFNVFWLTGAGQPTIGAVTPGTTTVISTGATSATPALRVVNSMATCLKIAANSWIVIGDIV